MVNSIKTIFIGRGDEGSGKSSAADMLINQGIIENSQVVRKDSCVQRVKKDEPWLSVLNEGKDPYDHPEIKNQRGENFRLDYMNQFRGDLLRVLEEKDEVYVDCNFSKASDIQEFIEAIAEQIGLKIQVQVMTLTASFEDRRDATAGREHYVDGAARRVTDERSGFVNEIKIPVHKNIMRFEHHIIPNGKMEEGERPPLSNAVESMKSHIKEFQGNM